MCRLSEGINTTLPPGDGQMSSSSYKSAPRFFPAVALCCCIIYTSGSAGPDLQLYNQNTSKFAVQPNQLHSTATTNMTFSSVVRRASEKIWKGHDKGNGPEQGSRREASRKGSKSSTRPRSLPHPGFPYQPVASRSDSLPTQGGANSSDARPLQQEPGSQSPPEDPLPLHMQSFVQAVYDSLQETDVSERPKMIEALTKYLQRICLSDKRVDDKAEFFGFAAEYLTHEVGRDQQVVMCFTDSECPCELRNEPVLEHRVKITGSEAEYLRALRNHRREAACVCGEEFRRWWAAAPDVEKVLYGLREQEIEERTAQDLERADLLAQEKPNASERLAEFAKGLDERREKREEARKANGWRDKMERERVEAENQMRARVEKERIERERNKLLWKRAKTKRRRHHSSHETDKTLREEPGSGSKDEGRRRDSMPESLSTSSLEHENRLHLDDHVSERTILAPTSTSTSTATADQSPHPHTQDDDVLGGVPYNTAVAAPPLTPSPRPSVEWNGRAAKVPPAASSMPDLTTQKRQEAAEAASPETDGEQEQLPGEDGALEPELASEEMSLPASGSRRTQTAHGRLETTQRREAEELALTEEEEESRESASHFSSSSSSSSSCVGAAALPKYGSFSK